MLISFVIPSYNNSGLVSRCLDSVFGSLYPCGWEVEAIVVDDGSSAEHCVVKATSLYPNTRLIVHPTNRGMCAARNTGIIHSRGDFVSILDADDELVQNWPAVFEAITNECPHSCQLIYAACRNQFGIVTATDPDYKGLLSLYDILNERHAGEYLPIFRGNYVRNKPYIDLQTRKSCGTISYINYALDGPFWVSNKVLRIYHEANAGSVSMGWTNAAKAIETVYCYKALLEEYGDLYQQHAPRIYLSKLLRYSVYLKLAGFPGVWTTYFSAASIIVWRESIVVAVMLLLSTSATGLISMSLKKLGLVRRYG